MKNNLKLKKTPNFLGKCCLGYMIAAGALSWKSEDLGSGPNSVPHHMYNSGHFSSIE